MPVHTSCRGVMPDEEHGEAPCCKSLFGLAAELLFFPKQRQDGQLRDLSLIAGRERAIARTPIPPCKK